MLTGTRDITTAGGKGGEGEEVVGREREVVGMRNRRKERGRVGGKEKAEDGIRKRRREEGKGKRRVMEGRKKGRGGRRKTMKKKRGSERIGCG